MTTYQCDDMGCTRNGSVYGMCVEHAPPSWLEDVLENDEDLLDTKEIVEACKRLREAEA